MKEHRKICVVTSTRADYGLLQGVMKLIQSSELCELQIIASGTHLVQEYGYTVNNIEEDGFRITKKVEILLASDTPVSVSKSMALAQIGFAESFDELSPDVIVLLGDRYEILSAASAALISRVPVAHIHGGEVTEGAMDESIRHAITKMSHIHFASTSEHRNRIIQIGENPTHVFNVGAPGLDQIKSLNLLSIKELAASMNCQLDKPFGVMTYHPVTLPNRSNLDSLNELVIALEYFSDMQFVVTYPNSDTFGRELIDRLKEASLNNNQIILVPSLGQLRYLSAVKNSEFVIGNSSSGIIEVPSLGKPTINIGERQKGRTSASSIINCEDNKEDIIKAIKIALSKEEKDQAKNVINPYKNGNASAQIFEKLLNIDLCNIIRKPFFDLVTK